MFIYGLIISIIYSYFILPKKSGDNVKLLNFTLYPLLFNGMVIIPITTKYALHIHHWLIYLLLFFYCNHLFIQGFSFGLCIQGFIYNDFYIFLINNPY